MRSKDRISYFYDGDVGSVYFGPNHPMKPHRLCMTHHLVLSYELHKKMEIYRPHKAYPVELAQFHSADYVEFLHRINPDTQHLFANELSKYNLGEDCPVFENLFEFCQIYAGGTIDAARRLNHQLCDIAINWAGGLHHAKKCEASGFCYINDLVLGILELLKYHSRVLYIDIDVHHGDGVEEAFYFTDRVMTVSFHKFGDLFFPGTGDVKEIGEREGKFYAINVPLKDGIDDGSFTRLFRTIISKVVEMYRPGVIVLQCGADSLAGDRLGCFNLSIDGHAECVRFVKKFNLPLLVTGGGGYTKENVARCWTVETGVLLDTELPNEIPDNEYIKYFSPDHLLRIPNGHMENLNTKSYLSTIKTQVLENLRFIQHAPGVQMQEVPPDFYIPDFDEDEQNPDERMNPFAGKFNLDDLASSFLKLTRVVKSPKSIKNFESRPFFVTKFLNTPSPAGLLQMLPKQTKSTEKGFVSVSEVLEREESAMEEATVKDVDGVAKWVEKQAMAKDSEMKQGRDDKVALQDLRQFQAAIGTPPSLLWMGLR
ncbi:unnamed protein product [Citrullus colocynthis]|uniref:histone deacetylase n=1 Tax=Citrullus colocynthis TaxID=252529 RepID=A0ABP0Y2W0_9ROSI